MSVLDKPPMPPATREFIALAEDILNHPATNFAENGGYSYIKWDNYSESEEQHLSLQVGLLHPRQVRPLILTICTFEVEDSDAGVSLTISTRNSGSWIDQPNDNDLYVLDAFRAYRSSLELADVD